ncbi:V-type ATPase 116kDa subunit family protein, partial [Salmonella sp. s51228]|uniref:V-type ATPase 116kDa subunit family protein n=1 Tax=Salmonella sp. s51228 TaxID=3159652 RepID=UPI00398076BA
MKPTGTSVVFIGEAELQRYVQTFLVIVAVICVPILLLPTPLYLLISHKISTRNQRHYETIANDEDAYSNNNNNDESAHGDAHGDGHFEFGEVFVH